MGANRSFLFASVAVTFGLAGAARAAIPPAAAQLDEVVVTATRRAENLIDVPVSAAVASGQTLERLNLNSAEDLPRLAPGLTIAGYNTPRGAGFKVRGIGTNVFADGIEQSVGTVVDGIPLARAGQGLADLIDVDHVEVLRGPQGLLFGRNASAGLINIVTRLPTMTPSLAADVSYGSGNQVKAAGSVSGPVSKDVQGRLTAYLTKEDGLVHNIGTGKDYDGRDEYGVRGQLRWVPTEALDIVLRADWSKRNNDCCVWTVNQFATRATDPRASAAFLSSITGPISQGPGSRDVNLRGQIFNLSENAGGSMEVNYKLGAYTLTSLTGYRTWDQKDNNDADLSPLNVLDRNYGGNNLNQFSQEIRLTSPKDRFIDFVAGLFYYDSSNDGSFQQVGRFTIGLAQAQAAGANLTLAPGVVLPAAQNFGRDVNTTIRVRDEAAFGQANVNFTPRTRLILGARLTDTRVSMDFARVGTPGANAFNFVLGAAFAPLAFNVETSDTSLSWRAGLAQDVGERGNLYATVTRGYKGPGFNNLLDVVIPVGTTPQDFTRVRPEVPTSFEAGYKAELFERRLRLNLAAYYTGFKDFQAQVVEPQPNGLSSYAIRNAGKLISKGFEGDATFAATANLTLGGSASYNDAYFESFLAASCPTAGALVTTPGAFCGPLLAGGANRTSFDASGRDAPGAPKWTGNLNFDYRHALEGGTWEGFAQGLFNWRSSTTFALYPANIPNPTVQRAYGLVNLTAGVSNEKLGTTLSVFVNNLFDKQFAQSLSGLPFDAIGGVLQFVNRDAERTLGIKISVRR
ncbi:TonB-dependent receptor [Phenylobacterium sp.]|uniref:TonB-dependent receptor n=1 Tax=Phenylobacterium sp. TaxID=1871053 RepID=UPI003567C1EC